MAGMNSWRDILATTDRQSGYGVCLLKSGPAAFASPALAEPGVVNRGEMSVECVLTTRSRDRQGDIVEPAGCDWSEHEINPVVMFHHGKDHHLPIGKAEDPDGNYTVRLDARNRLVGKTYFSQSDRFAGDVFGLVAENILRGVSVGFDPADDGPRQKSVEVLGESPVLDRPAMRFKAWKLLEYSHTPIGVNRDALTTVVRKAWDGSRKMHPLLLKSLEPLAAPRRATVTGGFARVEKAMPQPGDEYDDPMAPEMGAEMGAEDPVTDAGMDQPADGPTPSVKTILDGAQGLRDLCEQLTAGMKMSEHSKARKYVSKMCAELDQTATDLEGFAEKIQAELSGATPGDDDGEPDGDEMPPVEPDGDEAEAEDKMAAVQKALKSYSPKRWVWADLAGGAAKVAKSQPADAKRTKELEAENRALKAELAATAKSIANLSRDLKAAGVI